MKKISPSVLDVSTEKLLNYVNSLIDWGIDRIHYDIMDEEFVPNKGIDVEKLKEILPKTKKHNIEFHMMVKNVFKYYDDYHTIANTLIFHYEAMNEEELSNLIFRAINDNVKLGIAINPNTNEENLLPLLKHLDLILIMSVNPGSGGQSFIDTSYNKVKKIRKFVDDNNLKTKIEIDGGVGQSNIKNCFNAGVDIAVVGSYLVKNFSEKTIKELLKE